MLSSLSTFQPPDFKPVFIQSWNSSIVARIVTELFGSLFFLPLATDYFTGNGVYVGAVVVISLAYTLNYARRCIIAKVKTIRFYDNFIEMSGWKFKQQFTYQDVSQLSKVRKRSGLFYEEVVSFRIKQEFFLFSFRNLKNKDLKTDFYSWIVRKVPSTVLKVSGASVFR